MKALFITLVSLGFAACAATIQQQATENPLKGGATLVVQPVSYHHLKLEIMTEEVYLGRFAGRPELRTYQEDKVVIDKNFREGLAAQVPTLLGAGPNKLLARAVQIWPGGDMNIRSENGVKNNTRGNFEISILTPDDKVLDQFTVEVGVAASPTKLFAADRMREMGGLLADEVAAYLKKRAAQP